jgi:membrane protease YdiL (CAAX protease family)
LDSLEPIPPGLPETPLAPPPSRPQPPPVENPVFDLWDVTAIVVVAFVSIFISSGVALLIAYSGHPSPNDAKEAAGNVFVLLPAQLAAYILTVGFMVLLVALRYRTPFLAAVRWNPPSRRLAYTAAALGAGLGLMVLLLENLLQRWIPKSLPIDEFFRKPSFAYAMAAFAILIAPAVEELFFRGFLFPALARPLGTVLAVGLTGGLFALLHGAQLAFAWVPLLLLFVVGAMLTVVRARTQSVATTVLMHMSYNTVIFVLTGIASHGFRQ